MVKLIHTFLVLSLTASLHAQSGADLELQLSQKLVDRIVGQEDTFSHRRNSVLFGAYQIFGSYSSKTDMARKLDLAVGASIYGSELNAHASWAGPLQIDGRVRSRFVTADFRAEVHLQATASFKVVPGRPTVASPAEVTVHNVLLSDVRIDQDRSTARLNPLLNEVQKVANALTQDKQLVVTGLIQTLAASLAQDEADQAVQRLATLLGDSAELLFPPVKKPNDECPCREAIQIDITTSRSEICGKAQSKNTDQTPCDLVINSTESDAHEYAFDVVVAKPTLMRISKNPGFHRLLSEKRTRDGDAQDCEFLTWRFENSGKVELSPKSVQLPLKADGKWLSFKLNIKEKWVAPNHKNLTALMALYQGLELANAHDTALTRIVKDLDGTVNACAQTNVDIDKLRCSLARLKEHQSRFGDVRKKLLANVEFSLDKAVATNESITFSVRMVEGSE